MSRLIARYPADELARKRELFFPEERRYEFTTEPWDGMSFRHFRDPKVACIEHYWPRDRRGGRVQVTGAEEGASKPPETRLGLAKRQNTA